MNTIASPPVPKNLRDLLAADPAYLTKLEWLLHHVVSHPSAGVPVFEQALWAIEEGLSSFVGDAQAELDATRVSGDATHVTYVDEKLKLLQRATFKQVWIGDEELWAYFHGASDKDIL
jgi:hypothetical protein